MPSDRPRLRSSYEDAFFGHRFRYGDLFTPSADNRWALRYGLTWKPNERDKVDLRLLEAHRHRPGLQPHLHHRPRRPRRSRPTRGAGRTGIEHAPTIFEDNVQNSLTWRRSLAASGYTELHFSRYFFAQRQDVMGKMWTDYVQPDDISYFDRDDPRRYDYFYDTGDDNEWSDRRTTTYQLQGIYVQRLRRHEIEVGFDHQAQSVQYVTIEDPWIEDANGLGGSHDVWTVHPWVGNLFVRDRLDYEGFTGNVGIRADYWFLGREVEAAVADPTNPNLTPETREKFYDETRSFFGRRCKVKFSPRVIVAHPITQNSSFFFNYGQFTQNPSYRYVYSRLTSISSESFPLLGNPNLNPQVSVNYELGAKHMFLPTAAANLTFFVKDTYDYPTATLFSGGEAEAGEVPKPVFVYLNGHFARSRGFEIEVEKRRSNYWAGKLTYTYQQTKGKSSDPNEQKVVQESGGNAADTRLVRDLRLLEPAAQARRSTSTSASTSRRRGPGCATAGSTSTSRAPRAAPTRPRTPSPTRRASPTRRTGRSRSPRTCA